MILDFFKKITDVSPKDWWVECYQSLLNSANQILDNDVGWNDWEYLRTPETIAEDRLCSAISILSGSEDYPLAERYINRSLEFIDRIIQEDKLKSTICIASFSRNQGRMRRTQVFAHLLLDERLDTELACLASIDYEKDCKRFDTAEEWDVQTQYYFINAIVLSLVANDVERANVLLKSPIRKITKHKELVSLLSKLILKINGKLSESESLEFVNEFDKYLTKVKDPRIPTADDDFKEVIIWSFVLCVLREKYIKNSKNIDWKNVINFYSK